MKTTFKINSLAMQNLMLSVKTGFILAMITGFLYITYLGMTKPEAVKQEKERIVMVTAGNHIPAEANS